ncbi:copper chaperone PCu(A)C [Streptomyces sp. C10-9-1]|uniref:copper chaperone PCu(A)C n=1 Tax=Streptomyces sp. C10-9-1 TaxID=1859285 RepID=UPI0021131EB3|nr:copper chaperone PCu(A)C [Streptomyces sp. C10-9-1]MCQ6555933.1 copper chaperone PCu(A)C [Streptomyces sp. C10-9-1]
MPRRTAAALAAAVAAPLLLAGCGSSAAPELTVSGAFMPQPVSDMAAGFLTVENTGGAGDRLTSVTSGISDEVSIHRTEDGRMTEVDSFDIPAEGSLDLERGGNHIMFTALKERPEEGDTVSVELHFETSDPITVDVPVKAATHNPEH